METLGTFGFRGEALSSLCALCNLSITTRHSSTVVATRLEYEKTGIIKSQTQCARSPGTTVTLEKLFHTLPVRHKEFIKNLKREYHKLMHVVQSYCLISEGIKISCFNIMNDKSTKLISTHSKNSLKDNIIEIFSLNSFNTLIKFEQSEPTNEVLADYKLITIREGVEEGAEESQECHQYLDMFQIEGYISSCSHNQGRSAPDRQYFYVNKRPCDHSKITKLINEIYHQFNRTQYPMFVLSIKMDSHNVDVNVTPDKLQMFFKNENALLAIIKSSLVKMFNKNYKTVNLNDSSFQNEKSSELLKSFLQSKPKTPQLKNIQDENLADTKENNKRYRDDDVFLESPESKPKQPKIIEIFSGTKRTRTPEKSPGTPKRTHLSPKCNKSPFTNKDRFNMFQNHIGEKPIDSSFSNRIDLHLCNRDTGILDTPPQNNRVVSYQVNDSPLYQAQKEVNIIRKPSPNKVQKVIFSPVKNYEPKLHTINDNTIQTPEISVENKLKSNSIQENLKVLGIDSSRVDHDLADLGKVNCFLFFSLFLKNIKSF